MALDIVATEGHDALTMQRLAAEMECGIASIYRLVPSRDALMGELLHRSLAVLHESWLLGLQNLDETAGRLELDRAATTMLRAVGSAWFWVVAEDGHPAYVEVCRRLLVGRGIVIPEDQDAHVVPVAIDLFGLGRQCVDDAVAAGVLSPGDGIERSILMVASITGVVLTRTLGRWSQALVNTRHLARRTVEDSFLAWGADPDAFTAAMALVEEEAAAGRLAPPVSAVD